MKKIFLSLVLLSAAVSCSKDPDVIPVEQVNKTSDVSEDQKWFEDRYKGTSTTSNTAKQTGGGEKTIDWNKAVVENNTGGRRTYVPFAYKNRRIGSAQERLRLLITTDKQGNKKAVILRYIADSKYYKDKKGISVKDFTGAILVSSWDDQFIQGFKYRNAKIVGTIGAAVKSASGTAQRPSGQDCTIMTVIYYSQTCAGGVCYDAVEVYRETFTVCADTGGGGTSGSGGDGGWGGGGGGGGPLGGGGEGGLGCGSAIVCPDGSTNPTLETTINIMDEAEFEAALIELAQSDPELGNYSAVIVTQYDAASKLALSITIDTRNHDIKSLTLTMSGLMGPTTFSQQGPGAMIRYDASTNRYYFTANFQLNGTGNTMYNGNVQILSGWIDLDNNTARTKVFNP